MPLILLNAKDHPRLFIRGIRPIRAISLRSAFPISNRSLQPRQEMPSILETVAFLCVLGALCVR